jgi:hypothetical protein
MIRDTHRFSNGHRPESVEVKRAMAAANPVLAPVLHLLKNAHRGPIVHHLWCDGVVLLLLSWLTCDVSVICECVRRWAASDRDELPGQRISII